MSQHHGDGPTDEKNSYEEQSLEDFLMEEEDSEAIVKRKKRKSFFMKIIAISIAFFLVVNVFAFAFQSFSLDAINFLKTSYRLSQNETIQHWKEAVVVIQGEHSRGTGFSIGQEGLIVTNRHVIEGQQMIAVSFPGGELFEGKVVASYVDVDLAFIQISGADEMPILPLSENVANIGDKIYVIGNPLKFTQIVNEGVILDNYFQEELVSISAPIYRGNSGSPVINEDGQVVAVVFAKSVPGLRSNDKPVGLAVRIEDVWSRLPKN